MNDGAVLIDSSAWIGYLTGRKGVALDCIGFLLENRRAATNDVVRMEILTGAKDELQYKELSDQWEGLYDLPFTPAVWRMAERLRFDMRRKGRLIPLPDVLIASSSAVYGCPLLHLDKHYDQMSEFLPLKIFFPGKGFLKGIDTKIPKEKDRL